MIGGTASGNPLSCATAIAVLNYIVEHDLISNSAEVGWYFLEQLKHLKENHPIIGDVRGLGLLVGLEFVRDRKTKEPFPVEMGVASESRPSRSNADSCPIPVKAPPTARGRSRHVCPAAHDHEDAGR